MIINVHYTALFIESNAQHDSDRNDNWIRSCLSCFGHLYCAQPHFAPQQITRLIVEKYTLGTPSMYYEYIIAQ